MNSENPSVEELLRSLRETVETRNKNTYSSVQTMQNDVLDLVNPLHKDEGKGSAVLQFVQEAVEQAVFKIMQQNENIVRDSVEKVMNTNAAKNMIANVCHDYFESSADFEPMIRDIIEKRISRIIRA